MPRTRAATVAQYITDAPHKSHLNFMPTGSSLAPFKEALAAFKTGKDTVQLPYDRPLPKALLTRIAKHRVTQVKKGAKWMG